MDHQLASSLIVPGFSGAESGLLVGWSSNPVLIPSKLLLEDEMGGADGWGVSRFLFAGSVRELFFLVPEMSLPCGIWHARFGGG